MKKLITLALVAALITALCGCGGEKSSSSKTESSKISPTPAPTSATEAKAGKDDEKLASYGFSGVVYAAEGDRVLYDGASGVSGGEAGEKITHDSLFCIGSVSKQFAAAAIMQLQDKGLLSTSDTLDKYFPECPYGGEITLRQMLSMRSGITEFYEVIEGNGCYNELPKGELRGTVTNDNTPEENRRLLTEWLFEQPLDFEPGSFLQYTNSNYFLLAQIVEKVSGERYEEYLKKHIFEPLEMKNTGFIDEMLDDPRLVRSPHEASTVYVGITMGLGDMISCADDIDRWLKSFSGDEILSAKAKEEMSTNYSAEDGASYGYGFIPNEAGGLSHSGFFTSYSALVYVQPEENYRFFAVTNDALSMSVSLTELGSVIISETKSNTN